MGEVLVGTSSWTDDTLIKEGSFYPPDVRTAEARLRYYATQFPLVEVDSTYYFPPSERNAELWIERTPAGFTFNVKAYSLLTNHPTRIDSLYKDLRETLPDDIVASGRNIYRDKLADEVVDEVWKRFHDALMPLHSAGKLGVVLFQFPQWFVIGRKSREYVLECASRLRDYRIAIEFRHRSWMSDENRGETEAFLREHDLPYVCVDMPQGFESSVPPVATATAEDLALVRFHGRNANVWDAKNITASERFRYRYTEEELREWVPPIRSLASQARETHVLMNNCYRDHAINNARELRQLILDV